MPFITDICLVCDMRGDFFKEKATFIDTFLLKRRNAIAHGEDTFVHEVDLDDLAEETIILMRAFSSELDNSAQLLSYRA